MLFFIFYGFKIKHFCLLLNRTVFGGAYLAWHASPEIGNGSTDLNELLAYGLPKMIDEGKFPAVVTLGGQEHSFIVLSPQLNSITNTSLSIETMIDYAINKYRVDTQRIYSTGIILGGNINWIYTGGSADHADRLAAMLLVTPASAPPFAARAAVVAASNLPIWVTSNYKDAAHPRARLKSMIDTINLNSPDPLAKLSILDTAGINPNVVDSWTETYDPAFKRDGLNVYEWMLSYTRPQLSPRRSQPITDSTTLNKINISTATLDIKLNPNPVHSNLTVWITGRAKGRSSLTLYTLQGQRLSQEVFNKENESPVSRIVRTSNLPAGYYSILVTIGHHRKVVNFIKQ